MAGIDDNVAIIGDWVPPSPSPRAFFTAMLGGDISSKPTEGLFLGMGSRDQMMSGNEKKDVSQADDSDPQLIKSNSFCEQKSNSSRGGLVERMAARAGFNAPRLNTESIRSSDLSHSSDVRSPYLTIPPGLSPTSLLDSPVFLSNSLAQPSPTTGKFTFLPTVNSRSSTVTEATDKSKDDFFQDMNTSFAFKPIAETGSSYFLGATNKMTSAAFAQQSFHCNEVPVYSEKSLQSQITEQSKVQMQNANSFSFQAGLSISSIAKDNGDNYANIAADQRPFGTVGGSTEQSPPLDEQQDEEGDQRGSGESAVAGPGGAPSEDGYNWRKYGQKQVKGSEYPRSYYKCTHPNCQVKKKVERSHEGHITEIIYKGAHNHSKPQPNRRSAIGSSNQLTDMQLDIPEQGGADGDPVWASAQKGTPDWRHDNHEVTSTASVGPEYCNISNTLQGQNDTRLESAGEAVDVSSTFSNDEEEDDRGTHGSVSLGYEGEGDESESKRRKIEAYATEMSGATRAIREPRVVVQTTSEVDILDDGYRWRKYGQKVVKGNPNPRSYYKCTSAGCTVRKHVERASHDLKSVITTYEGKHNHDVPAARNSSHVNSGGSNTGPSSQTAVNANAIQNHVHRPEPSQVHSSMARFGMAGGRQQLGPPHGFSFGMNQQGLANLAMAGLGPGQGKMPVIPLHPYLAQQRQVNEMGFMLPKGEAKMEPISESGMNLPNGSSVYQLMSRLPLGPQM